MCGIVGILKTHPLSDTEISALKSATQKLNKRGPDFQSTYHNSQIGFGHARLSILDISEQGNQPMFDEDQSVMIVFNGEIYNFKSIREELSSFGYEFKSSGDTEVLLKAYKHYGTAFLNKLNGFFAIAIHDFLKKETILARDRFGIKPLVYYKDESQIIFGSEIKAITEFEIDKTLDNTSIFTYFQLNYIAEPHSIYKEVKKLEPGTYLKIDEQNRIQQIPYFQLSYGTDQHQYTNLNYQSAKEKFINLMDASVQKRMISDVPLGTFLSGGIDSSLVTALASRHTEKLETFSIGYADEPFFDETRYALEVAKKYKTNHHVFKLKNKELLDSLESTINYLDEPFADSSALAVNLLSKYTSEHVKVALSGDGADEIFSGYHKHMAEYLIRQKTTVNEIIAVLEPIWNLLPKSRNNKIGNVIRKLSKFSKGSKLSVKERYWIWASLLREDETSNLLLKSADFNSYQNRKDNILKHLKNSDFNDVLFTDLKLVLRSDMLRKVDAMSMLNSLEVRTPFLDHELVKFGFEIPATYKIEKNFKKKIVQDAGRELLPESLYNRPKKGFEVPLLKWFRNELSGFIHSEIISKEFLLEQNIFNPTYVEGLWNKVNSKSPDDAAANLYAIIIFNSWYKRQNL